MKKAIISIAILALPMIAHGAGCEDYPYSDGITIEDVAGGTKILATASISLADSDSVRDAKDKAILIAKAAIQVFLFDGSESESESGSDETIETIQGAVRKIKSKRGEGKLVERMDAIKSLETLLDPSMLRAVVPFGVCYSKSKEVRVTVGVTPETIHTGKVARELRSLDHIN